MPKVIDDPFSIPETVASAPEKQVIDDPFSIPEKAEISVDTSPINVRPFRPVRDTLAELPAATGETFKNIGKAIVTGAPETVASIVEGAAIGLSQNPDKSEIFLGQGMGLVRVSPKMTPEQIEEVGFQMRQDAMKAGEAIRGINPKQEEWTKDAQEWAKKTGLPGETLIATANAVSQMGVAAGATAAAGPVGGWQAMAAMETSGFYRNATQALKQAGFDDRTADKYSSKYSVEYGQMAGAVEQLSFLFEKSAAIIGKDKAMKALKETPVWKMALKKVGAAGGEGLEEAVQTGLSNWTMGRIETQIKADTGKDVALPRESIGRAGAVGAGVGALLMGASVPINAMQARGEQVPVSGDTVIPLSDNDLKDVKGVIRNPDGSIAQDQGGGNAILTPENTGAMSPKERTAELIKSGIPSAFAAKLARQEADGDLEGANQTREEISANAQSAIEKAQAEHRQKTAQWKQDNAQLFDLTTGELKQILVAEGGQDADFKSPAEALRAIYQNEREKTDSGENEFTPSDERTSIPAGVSAAVRELTRQGMSERDATAFIRPDPTADEVGPIEQAKKDPFFKMYVQQHDGNLRLALYEYVQDEQALATELAQQENETAQGIVSPATTDGVIQKRIDMAQSIGAIKPETIEKTKPIAAQPVLEESPVPPSAKAAPLSTAYTQREQAVTAAPGEPVIAPGVSNFSAEQATADRLGIVFNGMQKVNDQVSFPLFTDPQTGSTFSLNEGETVDAALARTRERFKPKESISDKVTPTSGEKQSAKEPWQMTKSEIKKLKPNGEQAYGNDSTPVYKWTDADGKKRILLPGDFDAHQNLVERALAEGKPVPPEVLADYPDLKQAPVEQTAEESPIKAVNPRTGQTELIGQEEGGFRLTGEKQAAQETFADKQARKERAQKAIEQTPDMLYGQTSAKSGILEDFGEKLGGARKDAVRLPSMEADFTDAEIASKPFSEIWPKKEVDSIEDNSMAAIATAIRDVIPSKPRKGYKLARWVSQVKQVRELMQHAERLGRDAFLSKMRGDSTALAGLVDRIEMLEQIDRKDWSRVTDISNHPDAYAFVYDKDNKIVTDETTGLGKTVKSPYATARIDGRRVRADSLVALTEEVKKQLSGDVPQQKMKFEVRGRKGYWLINKHGDPLRRPLKTFTGQDAKEALDFRKNNYDALVQAWEDVKASDNVKETDVRREENLPRTGKDYRNGKPATPEMFMDSLGFRGVEFGNWVSQGKNIKERQGMLDAAYDAFMDLADIIGIPPKAISLNGTLGLGLGSRGHGRASAHYEPATIVINLTKTRGAGSIGHEWFHGMDHYFYKKRDSDSITLMTERPRSDMEGVRPEVEDAFAALVKALNDSPMAKRSKLIDAGKSGGYWSSILERAARSFENYIIVKMQEKGFNNDYLANVVTIEEFSRDAGRFPYLLADEIAPIKEAFDDLFSTLQTQETERGVMLMEESELFADTVNTDTPEFKAWFKNSVVTDNGKPMSEGGKPLVVYHGTANDFSQFDLNRIGQNFADTSGFYFIDNAENSREYGKNIISAYLSIQNPLEIETDMVPDTWISENQNEVSTASEDGYDGVIVKGFGRQRVFVAFRPDQIKSIYNRGTFDASDPNILMEPSLGFYSPLERIVGGFKQDTFTPEQLKGMVKNAPGVKQEELDDLGFYDWLDGAEGKVTKNQALEFVRNGGPKIEEVAKGEAAEYRKNEYGEFEVYRITNPNNIIGVFSTAEEAASFAGELRETGNTTKFQQYQLPGGTSYREVLLTLPMKERYEQSELKYNESESTDSMWIIDAPRKKFQISKRNYTLPEAIEYISRVKMRSDTNPPYKSSHWDEENVLAHVRLNDRTGPNGKKILFIEEIQSDWHQAGRKKGYRTEQFKELPEGYTVHAAKRVSAGWDEVELDDPQATRFEVHKPDGKFLWQTDAKTQAEAVSKALYQLNVSGNISNSDAAVPDAPFKKSWAMLAFKRVLRMAAEQGYDSIAWTPGEVQAERYDLSKHISELAYWKDEEGEYGVSLLNLDGRPIDGWNPKEGMDESELENQIGKELARRIVNDEGDSNPEESGYAPIETGVKVIQGDGLKVGGEGMKGFYDRILPKEVQKYVGKMGGKVGETALNQGPEVYSLYNTAGGFSIGGGYTKAQAEREVSKNPVLEMRREDGGSVKVWNLPITDAMRESVMQGQSIYEPASILDKETGETIPFAYETRNNDVEQNRTLAHQAIQSLPQEGTASDSRRRGTPVRIVSSQIVKEFARKGHVSLTGLKFGSDIEIVQAARTVRSGFETGRILLLNDENIVVNELAASARLPGAASFPKLDATQLKSITEMAKSSGATKIMLYHNHPSGDTTPSSNDRFSTITEAKKLSSLGLEFTGHVIGNHNEFTMLDGRGDTTVARQQVNIGEQPKDGTVRKDIDQRQPFLGYSITSPEGMYKVGKWFSDGADHNVVLLGITKNKLTAVGELPLTFMDHPANRARTLAAIRRFAKDTSSQHVVLANVPAFSEAPSAAAAVRAAYASRVAEMVVFKEGEYVYGNIAEDAYSIVREPGVIMGRKLGAEQARISEEPANFDNDLFPMDSRTAEVIKNLEKLAALSKKSTVVKASAPDTGGRSSAQPSNVPSVFVAPVVKNGVGEKIKTGSEKIKSAWETFYRRFVSRNEDIMRKDERAGMLADNSYTVAGVIDNIFEGFLSDAQGNKIGDSLQKTLGKFVGDTDFWNYMIQVHNIDRFREGKPVDPNMDSAASEKYRLDAEKAHPEYAQHRAEVVKWIDTFMREWGVKSGLIDAKAYDLMREMYPNYFPTFREFSELEEGSSAGGPGRRFIDLPNVVKKATGSARDLTDPVGNIMMMVGRVVRSAKYNSVGQALYEGIQKDPAKASAYAEIIPEGTDVNKNLDNIVTVWVDGSPVHIQINDIDLLNSLNGLPKIINNAKVMREITGVFKNLITTYNPLFALRNIFRDIPTAYTFGSQNNPIFFLGNLAKAGFQFVTNTGGAKQYRAMGGIRSGIFNADSAAQFAKKLNPKNSIIKKIVKAPLRAIQAFNNLTEQAPRISEFNHVLKKTGDVQKALYAAQRVTVNFARGGDFIKEADAYVPYLNASAQGIDRFFSAFNFKADPLGALGRVVKAGVAVSVPSLVTFMLNGAGDEDDDKYKRYMSVDRRTRDAYYLFPKSDGETFWRIPKSRELGVLWGAMVERALFRDGKDILTPFRTNFLPVNPFENNIFAPLVFNLPMNKDWAGRPIVPLGMQMDKRPKYLQFDDNTSKIGKRIGELTGMSPKQIDYVIKSYTGVIGQFALPATTERSGAGNAFERMTVGAFSTDPVFSNQGTSDFYNWMDELAKKKTERNIVENIPSKTFTNEEAMYSAAGKISSTLSDANKYINSLRADDPKIREIRTITSKYATLATKAETKMQILRIESKLKAELKAAGVRDVRRIYKKPDEDENE